LNDVDRVANNPPALANIGDDRGGCWRVSDVPAFAVDPVRSLSVQSFIAVANPAARAAVVRRSIVIGVFLQLRAGYATSGILSRINYSYRIAFEAMMPTVK
jgi:hypothetical protein